MKRIALFALALLNVPLFARDEQAMPFWDGPFSALLEAARKQDKPALLYLLSMVAEPCV